MSNLNILGMSSITNSGTLEVMVADPNNPTLDIRTTLPVGGGGGGSYVGGLGIDIVTNAGTGTINNTGTIVLPAETGSNSGKGILLEAGLPGPSGYGNAGIYLIGPTVTAAGTAGIVSSTLFYVYGGDIALTNPAGTARSSGIAISTGVINNGTVSADGAQLIVHGAYVNGYNSAVGASVAFNAGGAYGATDSNGGTMVFTAGNGDQQGGSVAFNVGTGAANGVLLMNNLPTADPHQLGALWVLDTLTGAAAISQG